MTGQSPISGAALRLGWEEWVALPGLRLPAFKAKVDTGARTSALHAFDIAPFGPATAPHVRFAIHPIPGRGDVAISCPAPIRDRREITSSNGETATRFVIETDLLIGGRRWPIEVTLTDRGAMACRMLLGRQALGEGAMVSPTESFLLSALGCDACHAQAMRSAAPSRTLRIAVLLREGGACSTRRLVDEGRGARRRHPLSGP